MSKKATVQSSTKKLTVLVSVIKRLQKEVNSYIKEVQTNEAKVQKMKDDGKDPYDIRKQEEVLQESYMMVPDSKTRLEKAIEDLQSCLDEVKEDPDIDQKSLEDAVQFMQSIENNNNSDYSSNSSA